MTDHDKFYLVSMMLFFVLGWIGAHWHADFLDNLERKRHAKRPFPDETDHSSIVNEYDLAPDQYHS